jgi:hypothetical protein
MFATLSVNDLDDLATFQFHVGVPGMGPGEVRAFDADTPFSLRGKAARLEGDDGFARFYGFLEGLFGLEVGLDVNG